MISRVINTFLFCFTSATSHLLFFGICMCLFFFLTEKKKEAHFLRFRLLCVPFLYTPLPPINELFFFFFIYAFDFHFPRGFMLLETARWRGKHLRF